MFNSIYVSDILNLFCDWNEIQIYLNGYVYSFDEDTLPDCIREVPVSSIDSPEFYSAPHGLCLNIDETDLEDITVDEFKRKYWDFIV